MRLLVINFEMDRLSRSMPWSARIVDLLAQSCEQVVVLTSRKGRYDPPANVVVETFPFPRLAGLPVIKFFLIVWANFRALRLILRYRVDSCFIHMAAHWAWYLSPVFKVLSIPTVVWYAHATVTSQLRRVLWASDRIVTSTPEGFGLPSQKVRIIGQGIDVDRFQLAPSDSDRDTIITVARISPRKRIEFLIDVIAELKRLSPDKPIRLQIVGGPISREDMLYESDVRERVWRDGLDKWIDFVGFVPNEFVPRLYSRAFLHLNVSDTGSLDKTIVESLASGCPVLTWNAAAGHLIQNYPEMTITEKTPAFVARRILEFRQGRFQHDPSKLRAIVVGHHDLNRYVSNVLATLQEVRKPGDKS